MTKMRQSETMSIGRPPHILATAHVDLGQGPPAKTGALSLTRKIVDLHWVPAAAVVMVQLIGHRPSSETALLLL
jgi:hypothetical protein